jgi:hypothetical protein
MDKIFRICRRVNLLILFYQKAKSAIKVSLYFFATSRCSSGFLPLPWWPLSYAFYYSWILPSYRYLIKRLQIEATDPLPQMKSTS